MIVMIVILARRRRWRRPAIWLGRGICTTRRERRIIVVGGYPRVGHLEALAMHVVGRHRAGRADEEDGVNDRLQRLPRARGGSFQFGEVVDLTIHSVCLSGITHWFRPKYYYGAGNNWELLGETRARTFTNFDRGTVYFRHMGVLVSRICTIFYGESVLAIFASFDLDKYVRTCSIHTLSRWS